MAYPHSPMGPAPVPYSYAESYPPPGVSPAGRYAGGRTPSPTPSEVEALSNSFLNVKKYMNWRFWARKDWIPWYILGVVILVLTILISVFDKQIVTWLTPAGKWMRDLKFGWLIPIGILFVISFPPLFGHEIVAILVGVIWGLGIGFAIVAAGTFIGEIGNFYAFKYCCRARGEKMEKTSISYACLARVVREGGFKVALIIRLSVIPGHFSTAVFSTCGMNIFVFALAALLSLPKQLITVYLGVILEESGTGASTKKDKIISDSVLAVTILITLGAGYYIWQEINRVKPGVIYDRRKARQVKMANPPTYGMENDSSTVLNPRNSDSDLPLSVMPQRPTQFSFTQPERRGSGNYAGYGGYAPSSYPQGRYGEALDTDERKSTEVVGWETRGARVDDMRGAKWGVAQGRKAEAGESSDEDVSDETAIAASPSPVLPPALPPPPQAGQSQQILYQQPAYQPAVTSPLPNPYSAAPPETYQPAVTSPLPNPYGAAPPETPRAGQVPRYQLEDPPIANHTPLPSDSTYPYPPTDPGHHHAQTDVPSLYAHSSRPTDASYDSHYPLTAGQGHNLQPTDATNTTYHSTSGHFAEATDASYYTAAGGRSREPSSDADGEMYAPPPQLGPVRTVSPMKLRDQGHS